MWDTRLLGDNVLEPDAATKTIPDVVALNMRFQDSSVMPVPQLSPRKSSE